MEIPPRMLVAMPFSALATSACLAPTVTVLAELVFRAHKLEYTKVGDSYLTQPTVSVYTIGLNALSGGGATLFSEDFPAFFAQQEDVSNPCASDPDVQATVAKLITCMLYHS